MVVLASTGNGADACGCVKFKCYDMAETIEKIERAGLDAVNFEMQWTLEPC